MNELIREFAHIGIGDVAAVGGKNASLGEMFNHLKNKGVRVPDGFATTAYAFWCFLKENSLIKPLSGVIKDLDRSTYSNLTTVGQRARQLILSGVFSESFSEAITAAYLKLGEGKALNVAVRSSATAEDLPEASFAGQHDTLLNINGTQALLKAVKHCFSSLYTDRAIKYREDHGFLHHDIALSVGVQKMVRADVGCSGVGFTIEPESGFGDVILISGVWGLGENIVQGLVNPDEFYVFKPTLDLGKQAILQKVMGDKALTMVYDTNNNTSTTLNIKTPLEKQRQFVLSDAEVTLLAKWAMVIEKHYEMPMDIEWAKDGISGTLFITQARPETIHQSKKKTVLETYKIIDRGEVLAEGNAIGSKIVSGVARILRSPDEAHKLSSGDIIIADTTSPDWDPLLKKAGGIVTNRGGRTSHAAIVARELGVSALVGTNNASQVIAEGEVITVSCAEGNKGYAYKGEVKFEKSEIPFDTLSLPKTEVKMILSDPDRAFQYSFYPNHGIGLLRMEFIITHRVKVHPMALINFDALSGSVRKEVADLTKGYATKEEYFIDQLSQGIATIAAAFYPKEVILRTSDFKTNEYANLIGGANFEPKEDNPMLGFRGAARYDHDLYREGFALECMAIKKVREEMGLTNLKVMIPFCRTLKEGRNVINLMKKNGLVQGENELEIYMMVEIPSNVILAQEFAKLFDGFSIGSNDLTQLTLGIDRDSELMAPTFDENNPAVKKAIVEAITKANHAGIKIGLCGQAPSDFPEFASFLVKAGISSVSFNPDALIEGLKNILQAESTLAENKLQ